MYERHKFGRSGEDIAVKYLEQKGYVILERNFSCKQGEIDVIAFYNSYLVFIEIKSRKSKEYGLPSEAVTKKKIKHMIKTATYYLYIHHLENANIRIDVIEVYLKDGKYIINHLKQIV